MATDAAFADDDVRRSSGAVYLAPLVGRDDLLSRAQELVRLDTVRLLTLTGPGGIGKTRLVNEIALRLEGELPGGVPVISLESVLHAGHVAETIARALGIPVERGVTAHDALIGSLSGARAVLALDNLEHLPDVAGLVTDLLMGCPNLRILVTSRSPLRISGERVLPVEPLALPGPDAGWSIDRIAQSPSVQLFVDRAQAVEPSFALTEVTAQAVAAICRRLDGIPLAIELAATQVGVLPPAALLSRIETGLPLPLPGPVDAPDRHLTIENAIAWSYDQLSPHEQRLFRCLGVFMDGFGLEAANAVCGVDVSTHIPPGSGRKMPDVLPLLASLVSKSLVQRAPSDEQARFRMLGPIRRFAMQRLEEEGESGAVRDAHAGWYLELAERTQHAAITPGGEDALAQVEIEHENVRAALDWLAGKGDDDDLVRMVLSLSGFWYEHGHIREARAWLERVLVKTKGTLRARVLVQLGMFLSVQDDTVHAGQLLEEGMAVLRGVADELTIALVLVWQGAIANFLGQYDRAEQLLEEALGLASGFEDPPIAASMTARALANLGIAARARGDLELAAVRHELALRICREQGYKFGAIRSLVDLGDVVRDQGDYARSLELYRECLSLAGEAIEQRVIVGVLEGAALAAVAWNDPDRAARMLGSADALSKRLGIWVLTSVDHDVHDRVTAASLAVLGEQAFQDAWSAGRQWSLSRAIAEVRGMSPPADVAGHPAGDVGITLSPREEDILRLLVAGHSDREMAGLLFLSVRTVEAHVARLRAKLGVRSRTAAVTTAIAIGLVDPGKPRPASED